VVAAGPSVLTSWTFDPIQLTSLAVVAFLYYRRCATLARRGTPVDTWRRISFGAGLAMLFFVLASPVDAFGEEQFLFVHMTQHMVVGDLAPLAIVAGLTGPILRPVLAIRWVGKLRILAHPLVALPLWAVNLYIWHLPVLYEAALHHDAVHALQHTLFFLCGAFFWAAVLEPLPGPAWFGTGAKLLYIVVARLIGMVLANVLLWSSSVFYSTYDHAPRWGITPRSDQGIAGSVMMIVDSLITIGAIAWLFLKLAGESEQRQRLIEAGHDPGVASRAVRYGRGEELASR
jgi:cytochrome c oxidase assembly factor CtaG